MLPSALKVTFDFRHLRSTKDSISSFLNDNLHYSHALIAAFYFASAFNFFLHFILTGWLGVGSLLEVLQFFGSIGFGWANRRWAHGVLYDYVKWRIRHHVSLRFLELIVSSRLANTTQNSLPYTTSLTLHPTHHIVTMAPQSNPAVRADPSEENKFDEIPSSPSSEQVPRRILTASACMRYLRPLETALSSIERIHKANDLEAYRVSLTDDFPCIVRKPDDLVENEKKPGCNAAATAMDVSDGEMTDDATWRPVGHRAKTKYTSKKKSRKLIGVQSLQSMRRLAETPRKAGNSHITIATPLLAGTAVPTTSDHVSRSIGTTGLSSSNLPGPGPSQRLTAHDSGRRQMHPLKDIHGKSPDLPKIVYTFLSATHIQFGKEKERALVHICLRQLAKRLVDEKRERSLLPKSEHGQYMDLSDVVDWCSANLGCVDGEWSGLPVLIRAYGVALLADAVKRTWIHRESWDVIVRQLKKVVLEGEFRDLYDAGSAIEPRWPIPNMSFSKRLSELHIFAGHLYSPSVRHGQYLFWQGLDAVLRRRILPGECLIEGTHKANLQSAISELAQHPNSWTGGFKDVVTSAVLSILEICPSTSEHMDRTFWNENSVNKELAAPAVRERVDVLFSNILILLSTVCIARQDLGRNDASYPHVIESLLVTVAHRVRLAALEDSTSIYSSDLSQRPYASLVLLGRYITSEVDLQSKKLRGIIDDCFLSDFNRILSSTQCSDKTIIKSMARFILDLAKSCCRPRKCDEYSLLVSFSQAMIKIPVKYPVLQHIMSKAAVEAAMDFAKKTCETTHAVWAEELQEIVDRQGIQQFNSDTTIKYSDLEIRVPVVKSDDTADRAENGFRWEAMIGDWIARTPRVKATLKHYSSQNERQTSQKATLKARLANDCSKEECVSWKTRRSSTFKPFSDKIQMNNDEDDGDVDADDDLSLHKTPTPRKKCHRKRSIPSVQTSTKANKTDDDDEYVPGRKLKRRKVLSDLPPIAKNKNFRREFVTRNRTSSSGKKGNDIKSSKTRIASENERAKTTRTTSFAVVIPARKAMEQKCDDRSAVATRKQKTSCLKRSVSVPSLRSSVSTSASLTDVLGISTEESEDELSFM